MSDNETTKGEPDTQGDDNLATGRATGGKDVDQPNQGSTTDTSETPDFVGRVAGDDIGSEEEQGAERRAEQG